LRDASFGTSEFLAAAGLATAVAASAAVLPDPASALGRGSLLRSVALVAACDLAPWLVVGRLWRRTRRRNLWQRR
jgi:hypothetical protein